MKIALTASFLTLVVACPVATAHHSKAAFYELDTISTPKGMPYIMNQPYPIVFIDERSTILLRIEEYDLVRTIRMGGEPTPQENRS
jgi:hypothetical protein